MSLFADLEDDLSSDPDDEEYVPTGEVDVSEEDESGDTEEENLEETSARKKGSKKKKLKTKSRKRKKPASDDEVEDTPKISPEEIKKLEKKKSDDLWAKFLQAPAIKEKVKETTVTKICDFAGSKVEIRTKVVTESSSAASIPSPSQTTSLSVSTTSASTNGSSNGAVLPSTVSSSLASLMPSTKPSVPSSLTSLMPSTKPSPLPGLSVGASNSSSLSSGVSAAKKPAFSFGSSSASKNLLSLLNKKPDKINTLVKSKLDWEAYKEAEGDAEDLKIYNRGKNGFIERKEFEARTAQRQYEIERDLRLKTRHK